MVISKQQARRGLVVFMLALVATMSVSIWLSRSIPRPALPTIFFNFEIIVFLSYSPAIAALFARLALREGFKDVSFRLRGEWATQAMLIAWLWPAVCGAFTYGLAWFFGLTRFAWTSHGSYGSWGPETLFGVSIFGMVPLTAFAVRLAASLLFALIGCVQSFGEEFGWRGYMLTRLFDAKIPVPLFWNGLVWGVWHVPFFLVLSSDMNRPEPASVSLFFFVAGTIAGAYLLGYLRLRSGSIWPAVLAHASGNAVLVWAFDGLTGANVFWKGELYLLTTALPLAVLFFVRRPWIVRHWPHDRRTTDSKLIAQGAPQDQRARESRHSQ